MEDRETWKDVSGHGGRFMVSNLGRVKSMRRVVNCGRGDGKRVCRTHILVGMIWTDGYHYVSLRRAGTSRRFVVHRLVAIAFLPNPENKPQVNHKNGIKTDNRIANLEWVTGQENCRHAVDTGLTTFFNKKSIICLKDGVTIKSYPSIESTKEDGFMPSAVRHVLSGSRKRHKNYEWRYNPSTPPTG